MSTRSAYRTSSSRAQQQKQQQQRQADESIHELNVSRTRVKSAFGRLNTPPREQVLPEFRSVRRAQSANSTRSTTGSLSFSKQQPSTHQEPSQTMYGHHYDGSFSPRAPLRPHSPTRRNNPHPAKSFMAWRVPSNPEKTQDSELLQETTKLLRRDSQERFYQDYRGEGRSPATQDAILTRLANAPPPMPDTSSSIYGKHDASCFSSRRPSLDGIPGGTRGQASRSRHLSPTGTSTGMPHHHGRSLSETDAQPGKMSLKQPVNNRHRTATEPVQHTVWKEPEIWHHRSVRDHTPQVIHRTSVFAAPKTGRGTHFTIHPEWPDLD
ncbi:uncharacterized protein LOC135825897 [Sycon ciliatum]|uniref:uncharacterized protein LOC135825897 n=1 Tax=Sycon ciliatum TaxID=27933 RepID=UPI0031F62FDC